MYSSFLNQFNQLGHYFFGISFIFVLYPWLVLQKSSESLLEKMISNYLRMTLIVITSGYILAATKLYEFIGIAIVLSGVYLFYFLYRNSALYLKEIIIKIRLYTMDCMDGKRGIRADSLLLVQLIRDRIKVKFKEGVKEKKKIIFLAFLTFVIGYSAYLRFWDAIMHAAPAMSDASVTLAWMKYVINNELFHDGIYPQGFHIVLATIHKFAYIDPIYILKYTGPLNGLLIGIGIYFILSRITGKKIIGMFGLILYGIMGSHLVLEWMRQTATNSQEFGYTFIFPTLYFLYEYMRSGKKLKLWTAFCGLTVIGLVHHIALAFVVMGSFAVLLTAFVVEGKSCSKRLYRSITMGTISVVLGFLPLGIGILAGKTVHTTSMEFLVSQTTTITLPEISIMSRVALVSMAIIIISIIIRRKALKDVFAEIFVFNLSALAFIAYYYAGVITQNEMIVARFPDFWGLIMVLPICMAIHILLNLIKMKEKQEKFAIVLASTVLCLVLFCLKPETVETYKMMRDSEVEQYLRISTIVRPSEWTEISQNEGYSLVLGKGYHIMMSDFLAWFDPESSEDYLFNTKAEEEYKSPNIFIFNEKRVFTTNFDNLAATYEQRKLDNISIENWVVLYKKNHDNLSVFFEDDDLIVYQIKQKTDVKNISEEVWGKKSEE